jgi:excisionase family DNA binding protein
MLLNLIYLSGPLFIFYMIGAFMNTTNFLTAMDIAKMLKISKALAYRLISQGRIQSIRFGKTVRVRTEDLQKFIDQSASSNQKDQ